MRNDVGVATNDVGVATSEVETEAVQRLLADSNVPVILEDGEERVLAWTRGATALLGWSTEEMLGRQSPLPRSAASVQIKNARECARRGHVHTVADVLVLSRSGYGQRCELLAAPAPVEAGKNCVLFTLTPGGEARSQGLPSATDFSNELLEAIPIPVFFKDTQGRYVGFNSAWEEFFGRKREEWLGRTVLEMFPEDSAHAYMAQDEQLLRDGGALEWEGRLRNQRGETAPVIYRKIAMRNAKGMVTGIVGAILDITALHLAESRFSEVVELAPGALIVCGADGHIVLVNAHAEKLFGYDRENLIGRPIDSLLPERYRAAHAGFRHSFFQGPSSRPMGKGRDLYALRSDGSEFPVEIALGQLPSDRGPMVIVVVADITARTVAKRQLEVSLQEKTVLLDEVHHRVKNNLQVISSLLNLQASSSEDPRIQSALSVGVARLRTIALTHELLYERGDFTSLDLAVYLDRLIRLTRGSSGAEIERIELKADLSEVIVELGQAMYCGLIVNEMLSNAFKHAFPGSSSGRVDIHLRRGADETAMLIVSDNGCGFDPEASHTRTGALGLRLMRLLTEQIAGSLRVSRLGTAGESIRFELCFPCKGRRRPNG